MENSSKQQYLVKNSVNIKNTLLYFSVYIIIIISVIICKITVWVGLKW